MAIDTAQSNFQQLTNRISAVENRLAVNLASRSDASENKTDEQENARMSAMVSKVLSETRLAITAMTGAVKTLSASNAAFIKSEEKFQKMSLDASTKNFKQLIKSVEALGNKMDTVRRAIRRSKNAESAENATLPSPTKSDAPTDPENLRTEKPDIPDETAPAIGTTEIVTKLNEVGHIFQQSNTSILQKIDGVSEEINELGELVNQNAGTTDVQLDNIYTRLTQTQTLEADYYKLFYSELTRINENLEEVDESVDKSTAALNKMRGGAEQQVPIPEKTKKDDNTGFFGDIANTLLKAKGIFSEVTTAMGPLLTALAPLAGASFGGLLSVLAAVAPYALGAVAVGGAVYATKEIYDVLSNIRELNADTVKLLENMNANLDRRQFGQYTVKNTTDLENEINQMEKSAGGLSPDEMDYLNQLKFHYAERKAMEMGNQAQLVESQLQDTPRFVMNKNPKFGTPDIKNPEYDRLTDQLSQFRLFQQNWEESAKKFAPKEKPTILPTEKESVKITPRNREAVPALPATPPATKENGSVSVNAPTVTTNQFTNNATQTVVAMKRQYDADFLMASLRTT